jgi:hypothetical protein
MTGCQGSGDGRWGREHARERIGGGEDRMDLNSSSVNSVKGMGGIFLRWESARLDFGRWGLAIDGLGWDLNLSNLLLL